jgi:Response regulator containing a CheY-like receiver domain and an HTH DNA-binding domain
MILVIDDDLQFLKSVADAIQSYWDVSFACSGEEALDLIGTDYMPDIILLDIDMPGMNGFEVLPKLRDLVHNVPILFLSGLTSDNYEDYGLSLGAWDYIKKPFSKTVLLRRLSVHLEMSRRLREASSLDEVKLNSLVEPLTSTELVIARLLVKNYTNREIADQLHYSVPHIKRQVSQIIEKLGIERRYDIKDFLK